MSIIAAHYGIQKDWEQEDCQKLREHELKALKGITKSDFFKRYCVIKIPTNQGYFRPEVRMATNTFKLKLINEG